MKSIYSLKWPSILSLVASIFVQSCGTDPAPVVKPGQSGFFIVNEGGFGNTNASISFYDRKTDAVTNNVFSTKNGRAIGDQAQSMAIHEGKGYIVVQNSAKVEVINTDDYSSIATISIDLPNPRYFIGVSTTKGYVSDWGADGLTGTVKVIDLTTYKVTKTISTGKGANQMLKVNNFIYVTNNGGYGNDNTVKIIDTTTDQIASTITLGDNPNSIQRDKDGNIWIASSGKFVYNADFSINTTLSTKGTLSKVSATNSEIARLTVDKFTFSTISALGISPDGTTLYYNFDDKIFSMPITATALPTTPLKTGSYYGLAVDAFNGNIIGCQAPNFSSAGSIDIMDPTGKLIKNFAVGIGPNGCAFK